MNKLTEKQLTLFNKKVAQKVGLTPGIIDEDALRRVAEAPYVKDERFFYIYKGLIEKTAKLGCEIVNVRPFANTNIATATLAILTLLEINGIKLQDYENDIPELHQYLKIGEENQVIKWINVHLRKTKRN